MAIGRFNLSLTGVQPGGLVYVGGATFSAASTVSVDNVFSSTYDNYKILINFSDISGDNSEFTLRYRASGTDASTNYVSQRIFISGSTVGGNANWSGTDDLSIGFGDKDYEYYSHSMEVFSPYLAEKTKTYSTGQGVSGTTFYWANFTGIHTGTNQFDGFSIFASTGNVSGTIRVYGYRNDNN